MHWIRRKTILIVLGVVLFAPLFESFDRSQDMEQGTDLVLALLCVFVSVGLFTVCKRIISFVLELLVTGTIPTDIQIHFSSRSIQVEILPPEHPILPGTLRI